MNGRSDQPGISSLRTTNNGYFRDQSTVTLADEICQPNISQHVSGLHSESGEKTEPTKGIIKPSDPVYAMMDDNVTSRVTDTDKSMFPPTMTNSKFYQKLESKYPAAWNRAHKSTSRLQQGYADKTKVTGGGGQSFQYDGTSSQYSQILNSELFKSLYEKYPHAFKHSRHFHGATQKSIDSRRIFDSGLRVHLQGDTSFSDDKSICSEMPLSSWDREVSDIMSSNHYAKRARECMTSPTPSLCSNYSTISIKERLKVNSQTLNELLSKKFPLRKQQQAGGPFSYTHSRRSSHDSEGDFDKFREYADHQINFLQRKIMSQQKELYSFRKILGISDSEKTLNSQSNSRQMNFQCVYPESLPDSAIDTESGSIYSVSTDMAGVSETDGCDLLYKREWTNGLQEPCGQPEVEYTTYSSPFHHFDRLTKYETVHQKKLKSYQNRVVSRNESANKKNVNGRLYPGGKDETEKVDECTEQSYVITHDNDTLMQKQTVLPPNYRLQIEESLPVLNIKPSNDTAAQKSIATKIPTGEVLENGGKPNDIFEREQAETCEKVTEVCLSNNYVLHLDMEPVTVVPRKKRISFEDERDDTDPRFGIMDSKNIEERNLAKIRNNKRSPSPYVIIKTVVSPRLPVSHLDIACDDNKGGKTRCSLVQTKNVDIPESRPRENADSPENIPSERENTLHGVHENMSNEHHFWSPEMEENKNLSHKAIHLPLIKAQFNTNSSLGKADTLPRATRKSNFPNSQGIHNYSPSQDLLMTNQLMSLSNDVPIKSGFQITKLPSSTQDTDGMDGSLSPLENPITKIKNISSAQPDVVFQHVQNGSYGDSASTNSSLASETSECGKASIILPKHEQKQIIQDIASNCRLNGCFPQNNGEDGSVDQLKMADYPENINIFPADNLPSVHKSPSPSAKSLESSSGGLEKKEQFKINHLSHDVNKSPSLSTRSSGSTPSVITSTSTTDTPHSSPIKKFQETSPPSSARKYKGKSSSSDRKFKIKRIFKRKKGSYSPATESENFQMEQETMHRHASLPNLTRDNETNMIEDSLLVSMQKGENVSLRRPKSLEVLSVKDSDWNSGNRENKDNSPHLFRKIKNKPLTQQKSSADLSQTDKSSFPADTHALIRNPNSPADSQNVISDIDENFLELNNIDEENGFTQPKICDHSEKSSKETKNKAEAGYVDSPVTDVKNEMPYNTGTNCLSQTKSVTTDNVPSGHVSSPHLQKHSSANHDEMMDSEESDADTFDIDPNRVSMLVNSMRNNKAVTETKCLDHEPVELTSEGEESVLDPIFSKKQPASTGEKCRKVISPDYQRIVDYQVKSDVEENLETQSPGRVFLDKSDNMKEMILQNNTEDPYACLEESNTETTIAADLYESVGVPNNKQCSERNNPEYESINIPPSEGGQKSSQKTPDRCVPHPSRQMSSEYASVNYGLHKADSPEIDDETNTSELYAKIDYTKVKSRANAEAKPLAASTFDMVDIDLSDDEGPPLPARYYKSTSNLEKSKEMSASKLSLFEKMGTIKQSAKMKIKSLRKAVSLDKGINKTGRKGNGSDSASQKSKKMPIFKSLKSLFWKKSKAQNSGDNVPERQSDTGIEENEDDIVDDVFEDSPVSQITAKMLMVNPDGTQVIRIVKPKEHSLEIYISQGKSEYQQGIFVNRFCDGYPNKALKGLLAIGDEILEINDEQVQGMSLNQVYHLLAKTDVVIMKILPMLARNDI